MKYKLKSVHFGNVYLKCMYLTNVFIYINLLPDVQAGFKKGRGTRDQIANIRWIIKKAKNFQKMICFCFIDYLKPLTVWLTTNYEKFLKRWEYRTILPVFWETCMGIKKQRLELKMEQLTGSKLGKEYNKPV